MPTITQHLRRSLLSSVPERLPDLPELRRSERSPDFERLRSNRKICGAMRYGRVGQPGKPAYDRTRDALRRPAASSARPGCNDPCYCGSGIKYKHCCLLKER